MPDVLEIMPVKRPVRGRMRPPGSKSLTNRALIVAALAEGASRLTGVLDSEDTQVMVDGLRRLGITLSHDTQACTITLTGCCGRPLANEADLWLENSGTSIRFLTAMCALGEGRFRLDGNARMRERPILPLIAALRAGGVDAACERGNDCPPVLVNASGLPGGSVSVSGSISSQYLSALLMVAPCARRPLEFRISGDLVSRPYVKMTLAVMEKFGVTVCEEPAGSFRVEPHPYRGASYLIEPDASAASYFLAAAAVTGGEVTVEGLSRSALQGDVRFAEVLQQMGCGVDWQSERITVRGGPLRGIDIDMHDISDTAQTLAAVAPFAAGPTRIRGVAHVRHKETDRVAALTTELRRLGLHVEEHADGLTIHPGPMQPATIETFDDHRMAMSFAILGLRQPGVRITNPGCTAKTYPAFFADLDQLCREAR